MSHTHFLYHIVFATKDRMPLIDPKWERNLYGYMGGIVKGYKGSVLEINGMPDHAHLLARLGPEYAFMDFLRDLKANSSKFVRREHFAKFGWQRRYGAFSVSESAVPDVRKYIRNQKIHHADMSFEDEYKSLLRKHGIEFDEEYLWG